MDVTLKKAAALAVALSGINLTIPHAYALDVYAGLPDKDMVAKGREQMVLALDEALRRQSAVYILRALIGKANEGRINQLMTERACIDKQLALVNAMPLRDEGTNLESLVRRMTATLEGAKEGVSSYRLPASFTLDMETASVLKPLISGLKKKRIAVEDELAHLNFTLTIQIPSDVEELLREFDLI